MATMRTILCVRAPALVFVYKSATNTDVERMGQNKRPNYIHGLLDFFLFGLFIDEKKNQYRTNCHTHRNISSARIDNSNELFPPRLNCRHWLLSLLQNLFNELAIIDLGENNDATKSEYSFNF